MAEDWKKHLVHAISHSIRHERAHGNYAGATGLALIGVGFVLLPIPIIGLPLIIMGVWKLCKGNS